MMSGGDGGPEWPSNGGNDSGGEEAAVPSTGGGDSSERLGFDTAVAADIEANVSLIDAGNSAETRVSDDMNESGVLKLKNEESSLGDASGRALEDQRSHSVSRGHGTGEENADVLNDMYISKNAIGASADYDSILSEFDHFAAKGSGEAVGFGYEIGDMVWAKVKSHPWWPGHIYCEALASHSVQRSKRGCHVLVAFYGDSSYGWFDPAELVPFEDNFSEKSRQTSSRTFVKAVEEAVDELSRRRALGLACRCRNEFNFGPSLKEGYFVVDVGDYEPGVFSLGQINKARDEFRPKKMLSYVQQLALTPMTDQHWTVDFLKNKATVLACRKALFEEFDETYAQAFGSVPVRPPRPTTPIAVDPSKAPLSGRQVFADTLGRGKHPVKPAKTKDQLEKDKYLFVRRDAPVHLSTKKTSSVQYGPPSHPPLADGTGSSRLSTWSTTESLMHQASGDRASITGGVKPFEGPRKSVEGGQMNAKVRKRQTGELSAEKVKEKKKKRKGEATSTEHNVTLVDEKKNRKKETQNEGSASVVRIPLASSDSGAVEKVSSEMILDDNKDDAVSFISPMEAQKSAIDLTFLLRDLRTLALDPVHGSLRVCPSSTLSVFLKFRSLVYQKSLVSLPRTGNEIVEAYSTGQPPSRSLIDKTNEKLAVKPVRPPPRPIDDPTKGGMKRDPSERPVIVKKKKLLGDPEGLNNSKRMKISGSEDSERKNIKKRITADESKFASQRPTTPTESSHAKEAGARNFPPKTVKVEARKRASESNPTMLVMKFPAGAALPSGPQLRAKFARFGPLDLDATRVFWKTYTCRLVYRRRADAQDALDFAVGSKNLFGSTNVRCHIKEIEIEPSAEPEPLVRIKKEGAASLPPALKSTVADQSVQLKSILKKASGDEGGNGGNGGGRGTRVKFVLGGESSGGSNSNITSAKAQEHLSSFPMVGSSHNNNSQSSMDTKNLPKFLPNSSSVVTPLPPSTARLHQFQKFPMNVTQPNTTLDLPTPTRDISQQLLDLMGRCSDVVNRVSGMLGYMPYHAL